MSINFHQSINLSTYRQVVWFYMRLQTFWCVMKDTELEKLQNSRREFEFKLS